MNTLYYLYPFLYVQFLKKNSSGKLKLCDQDTKHNTSLLKILVFKSLVVICRLLGL